MPISLIIIYNCYLFRLTSLHHSIEESRLHSFLTTPQRVIYIVGSLLAKLHYQIAFKLLSAEVESY
jgi:hypothetical protein